MIPHKQLSLADIFTDCQNKFDNDKYAFLELLENATGLDEIVPVSFISRFHASIGRPQASLLRALLLQLIFSIPTPPPFPPDRVSKILSGIVGVLQV